MYLGPIPEVKRDFAEVYRGKENLPQRQMSAHCVAIVTNYCSTMDEEILCKSFDKCSKA